VLRPWRPADAPAVVAAYRDPEIRRWRQESGCGWAAASDNGVLGQISLRTINLDEGAAEISYWVVPEARGRRIAEQALRAVTAWSFDVLGLHRIEVNHSRQNTASCLVAEGVGYVAEGVKRSGALHADGWHDMHQHARIATDPA
jgi:ribosomal-protein-alanine N-acetyltransferase